MRILDHPNPTARMEAFPTYELINTDGKIIGIEYLWNTGETQIKWFGKNISAKKLRRVSCNRDDLNKC